MRCRCCENDFSDQPVLRFEDMPKKAQNFPDYEHLKEDCGETLELFQCPYCGTLQLLCEPVSYYKDVIRAAAVSDEMREFRLRYFGEFAEKYSLKGKKVLEIGAGRGEFLEMFQTTGADCYGTENRREAVEECRAKGLKVSRAYIESEDQVIENAPFDGFFIMNFLEHAPFPNIFLKGIHSNLNDGAIGLIEVPNVDMILKETMFSEFISDHLLYFTAETLCSLLGRNGFEVLECRPVWHDYCLAAVVRKRQRADILPILASMNNISEQLNGHIDRVRSSGKKVCVWGAGHQALAVLALCRIKDKIEFVVDSADFKQGKYTPGTHIKILPPNVLNERTDIGSVIVMAASYSDEVARTIVRDHPELDAVILRSDGLRKA